MNSMGEVLQEMIDTASPFNFFFFLDRATIVCIEITIILGCITAWVYLVAHAIQAMKRKKDS